MPPRIAPTKLSNWPWVVVRIDCVLCSRRGCYRLARLAARYGPEQSTDGLLRDLCQNCPWFTERPRKYEPRCGARFTDLDYALPPPHNPDEPIYRQRQPGREDVPKPKSVDCFPASYQGGAPSLANWPGPEIVLTCQTCERREVFVVAELCLRLGSDTLMTNVRVALSADCPRRLAKSMHDQCGALLVRVRNGTPGE